MIRLCRVLLVELSSSQTNKSFYTEKQGAPCGRTLPKATDNSDMYNREFPSGNFLFFFSCKMCLFRLPCGKLPLPFLAVPAGKDGWVECPCQTVDDFIGIRGSVCGLFLFVQTHAPLIVPPWQSRARKSKYQFLSGARARMYDSRSIGLPCSSRSCFPVNASCW